MRKTKLSATTQIRLIEVYDLKPGVRGYERIIKTGKPVKCTVICKEDFDEFFVKKKVSRSEGTRLYGISSHLFQNTLHYWYGSDMIRCQKIDKMVFKNREERRKLWESSLNWLENKYPGITDIFLNNLQNPRVITEKLEELNSDFYEIKAFIRLTKKYIRQACKRHGIPYIKFPSNLQEYRIKRILKELGYNPESQFYIKPYWYDFKVGNVLIEYDGKQTHNHDGTLNDRDKKKEDLAKKKGYIIFRIPYMIQGHQSNKDMVTLKKFIKKGLRKCLRNQK